MTSVDLIVQAVEAVAPVLDVPARAYLDRLIGALSEDPEPGELERFLLSVESAKLDAIERAHGRLAVLGSTKSAGIMLEIHKARLGLLDRARAVFNPNGDGESSVLDEASALALLPREWLKLEVIPDELRPIDNAPAQLANPEYLTYLVRALPRYWFNLDSLPIGLLSEGS